MVYLAPMSLLIPISLAALALAVLAVGLPFSRKFLRRGRYVGGIVLIAVSFAMFWPLQMMFAPWAARWGVYGVAAILPFIGCFFQFKAGVGLVSKANNTPRDD